MKVLKNFSMDLDQAQYFEEHKEINFSELIRNLLKRYFKELIETEKKN